MIGMKERIENFRNALVRKNHIMQLVHNLNLCLEIRTEQTTLFLHFQKNAINLSESKCPLDAQHIKLTGNEEQILFLLDGKFKLRDAILLGYLEMEGPYRTLLALESIFHLARPLPEEIFI
jgi:hypothetical protein